MAADVELASNRLFQLEKGGLDVFEISQSFQTFPGSKDYLPAPENTNSPDQPGTRDNIRFVADPPSAENKR